MDLDLFGEPRKFEENKQSYYLRQKDELSRENRSLRLEYLHQINPLGFNLIGNDMEMIFSFRELQDVYINGHFLSTIILGQTWIEKNISSLLNEKKYLHIQKKPLVQMIKFCLEKKIIHPYIIQKIDNFRLIRNPITHPKPLNYENNLANRSFRNNMHPFHQLENDAKEMISLCTYIAINGLK